MSLLTTHAEIEELGGGRVRQTIGLKPIAYRLNGNLMRILNQLGNTGDPSLPLGTDELAQFRVRDRLAGNSPVVHFGKGQSHVRFTPLNTANVLASVSGNTVTYPNAWPNADLKLSIGGHILRKDILLRTGHPGVFQFRIDAHQNFDLETLSSAEFRILPPSLEGPLGQHIPLTWAKSVQGGKTVLTVTLPAGNYAGWTLDPTLVLQPDATDGLDTWFRSSAATTNFSTDAYIGWGDGSGSANEAARAAIKFPLTSIPTSAIVTAATLSLRDSASFNVGGPANWAVNVHRLLVAFVEAQATWNVRATATNWGTAGAGGDGVDRVAAVSATVTMDGTAALAFVDWTGATLTADVQGFVTTPANNLGWMIEAPTAEYQGVENNACNFCDSSDHATAAFRPKLVVVYTVPSTSSLLMMLRRRGRR